MSNISERINLIRSESESTLFSSEEELDKIHRDRSTNVHRTKNSNGFNSRHSAENNISIGRTHDTIQVGDVRSEAPPANASVRVPISDDDVTKAITLNSKTFLIFKAFVFVCFLASFIVFFLVFILVAHASSNNDEEMFDEVLMPTPNFTEFEPAQSDPPSVIP